MKHETEITYRILKHVDPLSVGKVILARDEYNQTLAMLLDKYAPLKKKHIKPRKLQPWFTDKIRDEIQLGD